MPVILTGDVHQDIGIGEQRFADCSEARLSVDYAQIAADHGLKVTLFITGRSIVDNQGDVSPLIELGNVEIGGHGWDALRPRWWHRSLNLFTGSPHGLPLQQRRMIGRTCDTILENTGKQVKSWRNHAYRHDRWTPQLLAEAGIAVWSDRLDPDSRNPSWHSSGLLVLPINTLPDHENMYHARRTPEAVAAERRGPSYSPSVWCDRVCEQVDRIVSSGGVATILAHPLCMKVADGWTTFERLCTHLARYPTLFAQDAVGLNSA